MLLLLLLVRFVASLGARGKHGATMALKWKPESKTRADDDDDSSAERSLSFCPSALPAVSGKLAPLPAVGPERAKQQGQQYLPAPPLKPPKPPMPPFGEPDVGLISARRYTCRGLD